MSEISQTADKALAILEDLASNGPATLQRLSDRLPLNRTVAQRLLVTLAARGFISRTDLGYAIAPRLRRLSQSAFPELRRATHDSISYLARETGATVLLQTLDGTSAIVVAERISAGSSELRARLEVGTRHDLLTTASGIAILAALEERDRARVLSAVGTGSHPEVDAAIALACETGIALFEKDAREGVFEIASPVRSGPGSAACISLIAPAALAAELKSHRALLVDASRTAEHTLGAAT